jgi:uncharacterized damage-inducible protein DinB
MPRTFRPGAVGAMMDEYERAASDLKSILARISDEQYSAVVDPEAQDEDCRSIQTIMKHVVGAGYSYANYFRDHFGDPQVTHDRVLTPRADCIRRLDEMLAFTERTLESHWMLTDAESNAARILTRWGVTYDVEQLFEHAIVHILRHRRQIEKFLQKLEGHPV